MEGIRHQWVLHLCIIFIPLILAGRVPCSNFETCNCEVGTSHKNEYWCGENKSLVVIDVNRNVGVAVTCNGYNDSAYLDGLEGIKTTSNLHLNQFTLKRCSVPDKSFEGTFKILELDSVTELYVELPHNAATNFKPYYFEKRSSLEKLGLWSNNIIDLPKYVFKDMSILKKLHLNGNRLHSLPRNIFEPLSKLERLNLGFNNFARLDSKTFRYVSNLKYLNLCKNRLDNISKFLFAPLTKLTSLDLSDNHVTRLKKGIFDSLTNLEELNLNYNNINRLPDKLFVNNGQLKFVWLMKAFSKELTSLPTALFAHLGQLRVVLLDSNNLTTLPEDLFRGCADLKTLSIKRNSLQTLPTTIFEDTKNLDSLDLSTNNLEFLHETIFNYLKKLTVLKLGRNNLKKISGNLFANLVSLSYLDLSRNQLIDFENHTFVDLKNLTKLNLSYNKLTMESSTEFSPFYRCTELQSLDLKNNSLTRVFEDWQNSQTKLNSLDMRFNKLDNLTCFIKCQTTMSNSDEVWSNGCESNAQCEGMREWCPQKCGIYMTPTHGDLFPGLPPRPVKVKVHVNNSEITGDGIPIYVYWTHRIDRNYEPIQYIVEERHDYDRVEIEYKAENWSVVKRTPHKHAIIRNLFQPGVFYQFRVYAVNENGTVGPSKPCKAIRISPNVTELSPGVPLDFGIGAQSWGNSTLKFLLVWNMPPSLLPIYRYKLTTSISSNHTLFQNNKYFSWDMDHYWLTDIQPKTEYVFELNAVVTYNEKKIHGKPATMVVQTSEYPSTKKKRHHIKASEMNLKYKDEIHNVKVDKLFWIQEDLFADISWDPITDDDFTVNYSITWNPHVSCPEYDDAWFVAKAIEPAFELYDLIPGCNYFISVKAIHEEIFYKTNVSIPFSECVHKRKAHKKRKEYYPPGDIIRSFEKKPIYLVDCSLIKAKNNELN